MRGKHYNVGISNPNYKNGIKSRPLFCVDCNKRISTTRTTKLPKRCRSCDNKTRHHNLLTRKKMSKTRNSRQLSVGRNNPMFGKKGKLNPLYIKDLIRKYPITFDKELKKQIRYRDDYKCQICGCPEIECIRKLDVHHIDYDKENLVQKNLISLCVGCHMKTNFNRDYWYAYCIYIMENRRTL